MIFHTADTLLLACLQATIAKPPAAAGLAAWNLVPAAPIFNLPALGGAIGGGPAGPFNLGLPVPVLPSVMGANVYSEIPVSPVSLLWDAMVVGYGTLTDLLPLVGNPALANLVIGHAASRSHLLRANFDFPAGAVPGPTCYPLAPFLETSEKVLVSYLLGQTMAQRLAKICWNVPRVFHRSLYGPLLPALVGGPLPAGLSPDFVCLGALAVPPGGGPPALGLGLLEAKGTLSECDPGGQSKDRERINKAFRTQIAPLVAAMGGGGPWNCGVAVACFDGALGLGRIVGQLWDPPNPDARPVMRGGAVQLLGRYFRAMHLLLNNLEGKLHEAGGGNLVWEARSIGFRITIDAGQWEWMNAFVDGALAGPELMGYIEGLPAELELDPSRVRNGDGLILELI